MATKKRSRKKFSFSPLKSSSAPATLIRKHRKTMVWIAGVILILLAVYVLFGVRLQFVFNQELHLDLDPSTRSVSLHNGESENINFTVSSDTPSVCTSHCAYRFRDLSSAKTIDNGSLFEPEDHVLDYSLHAPENGRGQKLYQFEITCTSRRTEFCRSSEKEYRETALVTLNYDLDAYTEKQKRLFGRTLNTTRSTYDSASSTVSRTGQLIDDTINQTGGSLPLEFQRLEELKRSLDEVIGNLESLLDKAFIAWNEKEYVDFYVQHGQELHQLAGSVEKISYETSQATSRSLDLWNRHVSVVQNVTGQQSSFRQAVEFTKRTDNMTSFYNLTAIRSRIISHTIAPLDDQASLNTSTKELSETRSDLIRNISRTLEQKRTFVDTLATANDDMIGLLDKRNISIVANTNVSVKKTTPCDTFTSLQESIASHNDTATSLQQSSYPEIAGLAETEDVCKLYTQHLINTSSFPFTLDPSYQNVMTSSNATFNYSTLSTSQLDELCPLSPDSVYSDKQMDYCTTNITYSQQLVPDSLTKLLSPLELFTSNLTSKFHGKIPSHPPTCCFQQTCSPCCDQTRNCSENIPVIFVHGHALSRSNSPEASLTAFSHMQKGLQDKGYIDAGEIDDAGVRQHVDDGDWGRVDAPVTVRISYYYTAYHDLGGVDVVARKTDRIENYGIRLKEFVDLIKKRTDSDEVIIISHSMGGLVSREYIRLFGPDDVDTLITIGTPNHGVEGSVKKYCSVTGAKKECEDMEKDSPFLKRLNNAQQQGIPGTDVYTIRGKGCEMDDNRTGDGVILADNVPLDFATNYVVNGSCSTNLFEDTMHTELLKPEKYPQVFS
ncbi:MAG: esterase/lipase family protein, partial [Nanoarchaeota archaeon]